MNKNIDETVVDVEVDVTERKGKLEKVTELVVKHKRAITTGAAFLLGAVAVRVLTLRGGQDDVEDYEEDYVVHPDAITADIEIIEESKAE